MKEKTKWLQTWSRSITLSFSARIFEIMSLIHAFIPPPHLPPPLLVPMSSSHYAKCGVHPEQVANSNLDHLTHSYVLGQLDPLFNLTFMLFDCWRKHKLVVFLVVALFRWDNHSEQVCIKYLALVLFQNCFLTQHRLGSAVLGLQDHGN